MPHKRAKRSAREQLRQERGFNLAPERQSLSDEAIPKSVARVINAVKVREQWKSKKRELEQREDRDGFKRQKIHRRQEDDGNAIIGVTPSSKLRIQAGESIQHFNRRVEDDIQPVLRSAIQAARATIRRNVREGTKGKQNAKKASKSSSPTVDHSVSRRKVTASATSNRTDEQVSAPPKDFAKFSASAPKRLNDVAQAPPALTALPRRAKHQRQEGTRVFTRDVLESPAQRLVMDKERDAVIQRYRLLKERRRNPYVAEGVGDGAT
ncbi:hypothetical protein JOM56_010170 [Amanita muscaria]